MSKLQSDESRFAPQSGWALSVQMLRQVLDGQTYEAVAAQYSITRTAVEKRIKLVASHLAATGQIEGINEDAVFVIRLRRIRAAVLAVLDKLGDMAPPVAARAVRILSEQEIEAGAVRIHGRSRQPLEDVVLYYMLFVTGARPLEIARLQVCDYLNAEGEVRRSSVMRKDVAVVGRERPMFFHSARLDEAMDAYLAQRQAHRLGLAVEGQYRGLDPQSRLFLSSSACGFKIVPYGQAGQKRFRCRGIQETYRKLLRYAGLKHVTALGVRHTVADRLYSRGANETQVGLLLGISERSAVRGQFPKRQPTLDELTHNLV